MRDVAVQSWASAVAEQVRRLEAVAVTADWVATEVCTHELATLLATAPSMTVGSSEAVFRHAYQAVGRVISAATAARVEVQTELERMTRGHKAVSAYR